MALEEADISMAELARRVKTSPQQIDRLVKSQRKLTKEWAQKIAPFVKRSPAELLFGTDKVKVIGYVGAGAEVIPIDDHAQGAGLEEIDRPAGVTGPVVALIVRGDSMFPRYKEGEYLLHGDRQPPDGLVGRECVVWLADGRVLVKELMRGASGLYSLFSHNAPIIENVSVEAASPVLARVNRASK
jgi:phage repressor protein C with HTH and peptisase S24 domain